MVDFKNLTDEERAILNANFLKPKAELERLILEFRNGSTNTTNTAPVKTSPIICGDEAVDKLIHTEIGIPVMVKTGKETEFKQTIFMGIKEIQSRESFVFYSGEGIDGCFGLSSNFIKNNTEIVQFNFEENDPLKLTELLEQVNPQKKKEVTKEGDSFEMLKNSVYVDKLVKGLAEKELSKINAFLVKNNVHTKNLQDIVTLLFQTLDEVGNNGREVWVTTDHGSEIMSEGGFNSYAKRASLDDFIANFEKLDVRVYFDRAGAVTFDINDNLQLSASFWGGIDNALSNVHTYEDIDDILAGKKERYFQDIVDYVQKGEH